MKIIQHCSCWPRLHFLNMNIIYSHILSNFQIDIDQTLIAQMDPLTEQQLVGIYSLQHSSQQAEEALSQSELQQSLIETIANGSINDGMHHMAVALGKLTNLEGFVRQVYSSPHKYSFCFLDINHLCICTTDTKLGKCKLQILCKPF